MPNGTVKWFSLEKGFGFIVPSDAGKDIVVHITAVKRAGLATLQEGQRVAFELETERNKIEAVNLRTAAE